MIFRLRPRAVLLRLPGRGDLERDPLVQRRKGLGIERVRLEPFDERAGQSLVLLEQRAAHRLGRVRREDGFDDDRRQRLGDLFGLRAAPRELAEVTA